MKSLLLMATLAAFASPSAFAMKKVQFDIRFNLDICPLNPDGKTCSMIDGGEGMPQETAVAEIDTSNDPDNQTATFDKQYTLKRVFGAEADIVLNVSFSPALFDKGRTEMSITMSDPSDSDGIQPDDTEASITVADISTIHDFTVTGKAKYLSMPNGPGLVSQPRLWITNVKVLE